MQPFALIWDFRQYRCPLSAHMQPFSPCLRFPPVHVSSVSSCAAFRPYMRFPSVQVSSVSSYAAFFPLFEISASTGVLCQLMRSLSPLFEICTDAVFLCPAHAQPFVSVGDSHSTVISYSECTCTARNLFYKVLRRISNKCNNTCLLFYFLMLWFQTLQGKFHLCIPFLGIVSVSNLYIPWIGPHISMQQNR